MLRKLAFAVAAYSLLSSNVASALGLGEITLKSHLNEPLVAQIKLLNTGDLSKNEILPNLGGHEDFARAGVERVFFLTNFKFDVKLNADGGPVIKLSTDKIVREPYLNFLVELHWPNGRILREYTVFLDPPIFSEAPAAAVAQAVTGPAPKPTTRRQPEPAQVTPASTSRSASATQAPSNTVAQAGGTVRVKKNDTLWGIASDVRPDRSVTVRQTMLAIQRTNPYAFINGNVNLLKAGQVLRVPNVQQVKELSSQQASEELARQNQAWREQRAVKQTREVAQAEPEPVSAPAADGQLELVAEEFIEEAVPADVQASSGGGMASTGAGTGSSTDSEAEGSAEVGSTASAEVEALRAQLEEAQRLLSVKSEELAAMQANAGKAANQPNAADKNTAAKAKQEDKAAKDAPEEAGMLDMLTENPLYVGGGILGLVVLLVLLGAASRRRSEEPDYPDDLQAALTPSDDIDLSAIEDTEEEEQQVSEQLPVAEDDAEDDMDDFIADVSMDEDADAAAAKVIEEADIYIAYGRYERALDLLRTAVQGDASRTDLRLKLAEIYIATDDESGLTQQEADLKAIGDEDALERLEELKSEGSQDTESQDQAPQNETDDSSDDQSDDLEEATESASNEIDFELPEDEEVDAESDGVEEDYPTDNVVEFESASSQGNAETASEAEPDADESDLGFLEDTDESATKLELARAYIDMSDNEAAQEILSEVVAEGSDEQKEEAQKLLDKLG